MSHGCQHCEKEYASKSSLTRHVRNKHPGELDCGHECPTCGAEFPSERGMKSHHKTIHGGSISGVPVECHWCGNEFRKPRPNYEKTERSFCPDTDCYQRWQAENRSGENNPRWIPRIEKECEWCSETFSVQKRKADDARFCSQSCAGEHLGREANPNLSQLERIVTSTCEGCGDTFQHERYWERRFCSHDCYGGWLSENNTGEDHPRWTGGYDPYYGPNWREQRRKARKRDSYKCQSCGESEASSGRELDVHHKTPFREFVNEDGSADYERANRLGNLISLCVACHRKVEWMAPLVPQSAD